MKTILCQSLVLFMLLATFNACKEMDSTFDEFIVPNGITYTAKATSPAAFSGRNRVKISWLKGADPAVTKVRIFWNNYTDSVEVAIPPGADTISTVIDNLPEKSYSFMIRTYDEMGNSSVPVELLTAAYGEKYQASLNSRPVVQSKLDAMSNVSIQWGGADISNGATATEVKYTDNTGVEQVLQFPITDEVSVLPGVMPGTSYQYRTAFLPDTLSIDTFYTSFVEKDLFLLAKINWNVIDFSSQHPGGANLAANFIDGKPDTRWHCHASKSDYPHHITVDMGAEYTITDFEVFRWTDDPKDRACTTFQLLVSTDNLTWVDLGVFDFDRFSNDGHFFNLASTQKARYFKFVGLTGGPIKYMVMGEINMYGR